MQRPPEAPCRNACSYDIQGAFTCGPGAAPAAAAAGRNPLAFVTREGFAGGAAGARPPAGPGPGPEPAGWFERVCCVKDAARCDAAPDALKRVACKAACDPKC